jgi:HAD superfamily hydrolase (TIGR01509 family)
VPTQPTAGPECPGASPLAAVFLDFDGPVCDLFGHIDLPVAYAAALSSRSCDLHDLADRVDSDDLLAILRAAAETGQAGLLTEAEETVRQVEMLGAKTATLTPGLRGLIRRARTAHIPMAIVTNNSLPAVSLLADRFRPLFSGMPIFARPPQRPDLMKPAPYLLLQAVAYFGHPPEATILIGDSESDIEAARAAHVQVIAYANKPNKPDRFRAAGATTIVTALDQVRFLPGPR